MLTFEEAKKKAKAYDSNFDSVNEYEDAYVFYNSKKSGGDNMDTELVIMKDSGEQMNFAHYIGITKASNKYKARRL